MRSSIRFWAHRHTILDHEDPSELLMGRFEAMYEERFGRGTTFRRAGIEISTFRLVLADSFRRDADVVLERDVTGQSRGQRDVWFRDRFQTVPVYEADAADEGFRAPCMLEGRLMTAVIHPGQTVQVDDHGDFRLTTSPTT